MDNLSSVQQSSQGTKKAAKDDESIVQEIEKTIQSLLNLNIIDSLSEGNPDSSADLAHEEKLKTHDPCGLSSKEGSETNETSADQDNSQREEKQAYIEYCTCQIIKRVEQEGVADMNQLAILLKDCLA